MAEGIEVRFLGKLTYYAVSIYLLFMLGLLIVCRQRYKSRTERNVKSKSSDQGGKKDTEAKEMGLLQSKESRDHSKAGEQKIKRRRGKLDEKAKKVEGPGHRPKSDLIENRTANGDVAVGKFAKETCEIANSVNKDKPTEISDGLSKEKNVTPVRKEDEIVVERVSSEAERVIDCDTSANHDNISKESAIDTDINVSESKGERANMGITETTPRNDGKLPLSVSPGHYKYGTISSAVIEDDPVVSVADTHNIIPDSDGSNISDSICKPFKKLNPLDSFACSVSSSIVDDMLDEIGKSPSFDKEFQESVPLVTTNEQYTPEEIEGENCSTIYRHGQFELKKQRKVQEFATCLAHEIIFGDKEEDTAPKKRQSFPQMLKSTSGKCDQAVEKVSMEFCQSIAKDVCRDAPRTARNLEMLAGNMSASILCGAMKTYQDLPEHKIYFPPISKTNNLSHRRKIFCSTENICDEESSTGSLSKDLQKFSNFVGRQIVHDALENVKSDCSYLNDELEDVNKNIGIKTPSIIINAEIDGITKENNNIKPMDNNVSSGSMQTTFPHLDGKINSRKPPRIDSQSNFDADDEEEEGDDSIYSGESDDEAIHPVILRNKNTLKLKLHSDRPLSSYAEQLVGFLADDDNALDMFESDEEFDAVLDKLEQKYKEDENISTKILNRRRLSESRRKSESSFSSSHMGKPTCGMDTLDDMDERDRLTSTLSESSILSCTDTDEAMKGVFSDDQLLSPTSAKFDMQRTVVIDTGCGSLKAGLAGELVPRKILPSVIGIPRRFSQDVSRMTRGYYVGDEAILHAGMLQIAHPIKPEVTNWSDVYSLLEYVIEVDLQVNVRDHPILLTEIGLMSRKQREKITEIMFERFGAQAFYLANQGPLSLYSMGLTSGLCVNSGYSTTQCIPVYEGYSLPYCTNQLDVGGKQISDYLGRLLLSERGLAFSTSSEKFLLSDMMKTLCYVAENPKTERERLKKHYDDVRQIYELPDGQLIDIASERFESAEILYSPDLLGLEQSPLHEMVIDSVASAEQDLKTMLMSNTLITGGTTKLSGYAERLEKELSDLGDRTGHFRITKANDPITATWTGASVISSLSTFSQQCILTEQYAEIGAQIVHLKCF